MEYCTAYESPGRKQPGLKTSIQRNNICYFHKTKIEPGFDGSYDRKNSVKKKELCRIPVSILPSLP
jgi:hypothetical protein